MRREYAELHRAIQNKIGGIARQLYARELITASTRDMVISTQAVSADEAKADSLLRDIEAAMHTHENPGKCFGELLEILEEAGGVSSNVATSVRKVCVYW